MVTIVAATITSMTSAGAVVSVREAVQVIEISGAASSVAGNLAIPRTIGKNATACLNVQIFSGNVESIFLGTRRRQRLNSRSAPDGQITGKANGRCQIRGSTVQDRNGVERKVFRRDSRNRESSISKRNCVSSPEEPCRKPEQRISSSRGTEDCFGASTLQDRASRNGRSEPMA